MSYLSLLFSLPMRSLSNASGASRQPEREVFAEPDAIEEAWTSAGNGASDYPLPLGIASMEHWLDLNA